MITLTPSATNEIGRLKARQQPDIFVRLLVKAGGCSGWIYEIFFDVSVKVADQVFELPNMPNIKLLVDGESLKFIPDLTVDYSEDLMGGAFRFNNPLAIATCSCGNSFSISP
jgi:iron-sulfur cluster assembly accessory protein